MIKHKTPSWKKGMTFIEISELVCLNCYKIFGCYKSANRKFCCHRCSTDFCIGKTRPEHSVKMKRAHKIKQFGYKKGELIGVKNYFYGCHHTSTFKKQQRIKRQNYIKSVGGIPQLGKNEKFILDSIAKSNNIKIIRQYSINGYWVDGYCKKTNTVYEIDERPKNRERDIIREKEIKNELKCIFVRINDYE